jgi:hypothetical protein
VVYAFALCTCSSGGGGAAPRVDVGDASPSEAAMMDSDAVRNEVSAARADASGDGSVSGPVEAASACAAYAKAFCERFLTCDPRAFLTSYFVSLDECQSRLSVFCPNEFAAPGTGSNPTVMAACARATASQTCAAWYAGLATDCTPAGSLPNGAGCAYHSQCRSTLCRRSRAGWCGTCQDRVPVGGMCEPSQLDCEAGLTCAANCAGSVESEQCGGIYGFVCATRVLLGGGCDKEFQCAFGLACLGGVCSAVKTEGQPCQNFWQCGGDTSCGTVCTANLHLAPSASCSPVFFQQCAGGRACVVPDGGTNDGATCGPPAAEGQSCSFNAECQSPAHCHEGTCRGAIDARSCAP